MAIVPRIFSLSIISCACLLAPSHLFAGDCDQNGIEDSQEVFNEELSSTLYFGSGPETVAAADLDGDGDLDLAAANFRSSNVSVRLDDGSGKFADPVHFETGQGSTFVLAADLDHDGDVDLAAANQLESSISVLLNDGTAQFARTNYTVGPMPLAVAAADLDGDQNLDLAVPNYDARDISVLRGKGDGTFESQVKFTGGDKPSFVQPLDADGDRDLDLAVANSRGRSISILKNPGTGAIAFNAPVTVKIGGNPNYLAAADLDGDGDPDLAAANWGLFGGELSVLLLRNDGSGSFSPGSLLNEGYDSNCLAVGDLNGDGRPDLAVSNFFHESVGIYLNAGSGQFNKNGAYHAGARPLNLALADLDGDGDLDLAVPSQGSSNVWILIKEPLAKRQDLNGNGRWDRCDTDCNHNGISDDLDIKNGARDRNGNGLPDECDNASFIRGDVDKSGNIVESDAATIFIWSFDSDVPIGCFDAMDANDDGRIDVSDPCAVIGDLFLDYALPPPRLGGPGKDETPDGIDCTGIDYFTAVPPAENLALGFEGSPVEVTGTPGERKTFELFATLTGAGGPGGKGAQGWSISLAADHLQVIDITTASTAGEDAFLEKSEIIGQGTGAVSAVVLPPGKTLPASGAQRLARIVLEGVIPAGEETAARLRFAENQKGSGQPVENVVVLGWMPNAPQLGEGSIILKPAGGRQLPGDCNQDGGLDISDGICILGTLFLGIPERFPCGDGRPGDPGNRSLLDWQPDGGVDLSDAVALLQFLYLGGPAHPMALPGTETTACITIAGCPGNSNCP